MKYSIIFVLVPLAISFPYSYYPQQMPVYYQQSLYDQRYNIPSYYYNNYYRQPCYKCHNHKNNMFPTSQQQTQNYNNNNNIPMYTSGYQRSQYANRYDEGLSNIPTIIPNQSSFISNENKNINTDTSINNAFPIFTDSNLPTSPQFLDERTTILDKGQQEVIIIDNDKLRNTNEPDLEITYPPIQSNTNDHINVSPAIIINENNNEIPVSTPITKNVPEEPTIDGASPETFNTNNENNETIKQLTPKIEFNVDSNNNNNKESKTSLIVDSKNDADYVLYQEVASPKNSSKNGDSDFYDSTISSK